MRILVCGGRDYTNERICEEVLNGIRQITCIIEGGARGADSLARSYAERHSYELLEYPADWGKYGKSAGYKRNKQMLEEGKPDLVVAFPGGKGTANMVKLAKEAGVKVHEIS